MCGFGLCGFRELRASCERNKAELHKSFQRNLCICVNSPSVRLTLNLDFISPDVL